jgi:hypothetical protein
LKNILKITPKFLLIHSSYLIAKNAKLECSSGETRLFQKRSEHKMLLQEKQGYLEESRLALGRNMDGFLQI